LVLSALRRVGDRGSQVAVLLERLEAQVAPGGGQVEGAQAVAERRGERDVVGDADCDEASGEGGFGDADPDSAAVAAIGPTTRCFDEPNAA
jgi:hypothetical protein